MIFLTKIKNWILENKTIIALIIANLLIIDILILIGRKTDLNQHEYQTNIELFKHTHELQQQQISILTNKISDLQKILSERQKQDSIIQQRGIATITEIKALIKAKKYSNAKEKTIINSSDINKSYDILTRNIENHK